MSFVLLLSLLSLPVRAEQWPDEARQRYGPSFPLEKLGSPERLRRLESLIDACLAEVDPGRRQRALDALKADFDLPIEAFERLASVWRGPVSDAAEATARAATDPSEEPAALPRGLEPVRALPGLKLYRAFYAVEGAGEPQELVIGVPDTYSSSKPSPALLALHGMGGSGRQAAEAWAAAAAEHGLLLACPTAHPRWGFGITTSSQRHLRAARDWMLRQLHVDADRLSVSGVSMGGHATWHLAAHHPDWFSAAAPLIGSPREVLACLENLGPLSLYIVNGQKDEGIPLGPVRGAATRLQRLRIPHRLVIHEDRGHEVHADDYREAAAWMAPCQRRPYPSSFTLLAGQEDHFRAFWVEILEASGNTSQELSILDSTTGSEIERIRTLKPPVRIEARAEGNTLRLVTRNARKIRLFLSSRMLDLHRPVTVEVNGRRLWEQAIEPSAAFVLADLLRSGDRGMTFAASVEVVCGE
ncbi:MAG: dienelactone hydrolase family protein [Planctomycetes bacterium]|nr:dienelactone hydrolase family protein [Planctomycetota bacterium]